MSKTGCIISHEGIEYLCGLIRDINGLDTNLIDDINIKSNGTFSSVRINTLLNTLKTDCIDFANSLVSNLSRLELKLVTDESSIVDSNILYLYKPTGQTSYNQYVVIEGNKVLLGTTDINMTDYYTITQADNKFVLKTDFDALKTEVDKVKTTLGTDSLTTTSQTVTGAINELENKSTIVTLTQAEYNQLVSDGKVDNDTYYIISDDSENLDLNKFNIKTYTRLEQLGLTAPVTTGELFNAMPSDSIARIPSTIEETIIISDVPYPYGILLIDKSYSDRFDIEFKKSHGGASVDSTKWIGQLKGSDGTGLTWSRVCTTSISDTSGTGTLVHKDGSTVVKGTVTYEVINGICYCTLLDIAEGLTGAKICSVIGVPKSKVLVSIAMTNNGTATGSVAINKDSNIIYVYKSSTNNGTCSLSYPVAES